MKNSRSRPIRKRNSAVFRRRKLTLEKCEERTLLAGPSDDGASFMVDLSPGLAHSVVTDLALVQIQISSVANDDTVRLNVSRVPQSQALTFQYLPRDSYARYASSDSASAADTEYVHPVFGDARFLSNLSTALNANHGQTVAVEVHNRRDQSLEIAFSTASSVDRIVVKATPEPVTPTIAGIQSEPSPVGTSNIDDSVPFDPLIPAVSSGSVSTRPTTFSAPEFNPIDRFPGEGEVVRLWSEDPDPLMGNHEELSSEENRELVSHRSDPQPESLKSSSRQTVAVTLNKATRDAVGVAIVIPNRPISLTARGTGASNVGELLEAGRNARVSPSVARAQAASFSRANKTRSSTNLDSSNSLFVSVAGPEVALVFETGTSVTDGWEHVSRQSPATIPATPGNVGEVAEISQRFVSLAKDPIQRVETVPDRWNTPKLAAAPAIVIVAGAIWSKVRSAPERNNRIRRQTSIGQSQIRPLSGNTDRPDC